MSHTTLIDVFKAIVISQLPLFISNISIAIYGNFQHKLKSIMYCGMEGRLTTQALYENITDQIEIVLKPYYTQQSLHKHAQHITLQLTSR